MTVDFTGDDGPKEVRAGAAVRWPFRVSGGDEARFTVEIATGPDADDAPEWAVAICDSSGEIWNSYLHTTECTADLPAAGAREFVLEVTCPKGARYGEFAEVTVRVAVGNGVDSVVAKAVAVQSIVVLKTQMDQERSVADSLAAKADLGDKDIYAILSPANLRGYIFVEGMNTDRMREKTRDIRKARSFVEGESSIDEIGHYLQPLSPVVGLAEDDLVELVSGPFKGECAKVQQIEAGKEEIKVLLVGAMVPIPITVKADSVRKKEN